MLMLTLRMIAGTQVTVRDVVHMVLKYRSIILSIGLTSLSASCKSHFQHCVHFLMPKDLHRRDGQNKRSKSRSPRRVVPLRVRDTWASRHVAPWTCFWRSRGASFFQALALILPKRLGQFGAQERSNGSGGRAAAEPRARWSAADEELSNSVWAFATLLLSAEPLLDVLAEASGRACVSLFFFGSDFLWKGRKGGLRGLSRLEAIATRVEAIASSLEVALPHIQQRSKGGFGSRQVALPKVSAWRPQERLERHRGRRSSGFGGA